jgi:hypothetical protein
VEGTKKKPTVAKLWVFILVVGFLTQKNYAPTVLAIWVPVVAFAVRT